MLSAILFGFAIGQLIVLTWLWSVPYCIALIVALLAIAALN